MQQDEIDALISCTKHIQKANPSQGMLLGSRCAKKNLELQSCDEAYRFQVFIRQSEILIEDFSIGLIWKSANKSIGSITLIRFNGSHGQSDWSQDGHYSAFHIHRITSDLIEQGIREPKDIKITKLYQSFEQALAAFSKEVNIENWQAYFPNLRQASLFLAEEHIR